MLRLYDHRTGRPEPVQPARQGQLRTYLALAADSSPLPPGDLRAAIVADLIRRVASHHRLRVGAWQSPPAGAGEQALRDAWHALNLYPPELSAPPTGPADVTITAPDDPPAGPGLWIRPASTGSAGGAHVPRSAGDPLALRLAFLRRHYREPVTVTPAGLTDGVRALRDWRGQVADWARSPSKPMCASYVHGAVTALDSDLDTAAALGTLAALARDPEISPGSKFETFAFLDHLFGLDLARDVGRA